MARSSWSRDRCGRQAQRGRPRSADQLTTGRDSLAGNRHHPRPRWHGWGCRHGSVAGSSAGGSGLIMWTSPSTVAPRGASASQSSRRPLIPTAGPHLQPPPADQVAPVLTRDHHVVGGDVCLDLGAFLHDDRRGLDLALHQTQHPHTLACRDGALHAIVARDGGLLRWRFGRGRWLRELAAPSC